MKVITSNTNRVADSVSKLGLNTKLKMKENWNILRKRKQNISKLYVPIVISNFVKPISLRDTLSLNTTLSQINVVFVKEDFSLKRPWHTMKIWCIQLTRLVSPVICARKLLLLIQPWKATRSMPTQRKEMKNVPIVLKSSNRREIWDYIWPVFMM